MRENIRIWVYSGDVDANVPITGTLAWISQMKEDQGLPTVEPWREWWVPGLHKHEDQVGGMTWRIRGMTFASIKGAGHMAPKDKRREGFTLVTSFLNGSPLPYKS
jgi:serine carboxypeptidase-like clade 2